MPTSPNIYKFDNLVGSDLSEQVWNVLDKPIWRFGWNSNKRHKDDYAFWNAKFVGEKHQPLAETDYILFQKNWPAIAKLWEEISVIIRNEMHVPVILSRAYANGYTYGTGGSMHKDDGVWTCLYYATMPWDPMYRGETLFFDDNKNLIDAVEYIPGRFCIFPAKMFHQAGDVMKTCNALRTIIAFKCH